MAVATFEELSAGFCDIAGLPAPTLEPDERGLIAFHVKFRGVTVDVMHWPERCADSAFIVFTFGPVSPDDRSQAESLRSLLTANFVSFRQPQPVFGCNPANGNVVLQYTCALFDATPHTLLELVEQGTASALQWREQSGKAEPSHETTPAPGSLA